MVSPPGQLELIYRSARKIGSLIEAQTVVDGFLQILPRSQIALGGLDGGVAEQELNLARQQQVCVDLL